MFRHAAEDEVDFKNLITIVALRLLVREGHCPTDIFAQDMLTGLTLKGRTYHRKGKGKLWIVDH